MPSKQCPPSNVLQAMSSPNESCLTTRKPTKTLTPQYPSLSGWYDGKHEEGWPFVSQVTCHRGVPRACHPSQSHACLAGGYMGLARRQWWPRYGRLHTAGAWWGASQGLRARASHTDTGDRGIRGGQGQDRDATQRNLGEEMRAWELRESSSLTGGKKHTGTGKRLASLLVS